MFKGWKIDRKTNPRHPRVCAYCGEPVNGECFIFEKCVRPPRTPNRYLRLGYVCDACEAQGMPTTIGFNECR